MTPSPTATAAARTGPLNAAGAKLHAQTILGHLDAAEHRLASARHAARELERREGWRALGYDSWRACVGAEFGEGRAAEYPLLDLARIEERIFHQGGDGTDEATSAASGGT